MSTYQTLYRKWRPKTFSEMVGQSAIRKTLRNQVKTGRIGHAYLFCGSRGTGKTSAAKILARAVNCEHPKDGDPCGECASCVAIGSEASLDVFEMDAASNSRVEDMREVLEKVEYPPQFSRYKVYIIDEVHMLSNSAFNALLKTLEEPPEYMIFILATTEPQKLPVTILSRCQRYDFGRISPEEIAGRLRLGVDGSGKRADEAALNLIAQAAEGGMRDAWSILDMCLGMEDEVTEETVRTVLGATDRQTLFQMADAVADFDGDKAIRLCDRVMREGRDVQVFLRDFSAHLRKLLIAKLCGAEPALLQVSGDQAGNYRDQAARFTVRHLERAAECVMKAEGDTRWAASARGVMEMAVLGACDRASSGDTRALEERVEQLEKQLSELQSGGRILSAPVKTQPSAPQEKEKEPPAPIPEDEVWKKAKASLPGMITGLLSQARYIGCVNHEYRVALSEEAGLNLNLLSSPDRLTEIEEALRRAGDPDARFQALREGRPETAEHERLVREALRALRETIPEDKLIIES